MARLIEVEGIDGAGKTTAFEYLKEKLSGNAYNMLTTREVGNPHVEQCVELRKTVLNPDREMDGRAMEFVFAAMRLENQKFYKEIDDKYDFILCDRGWFSHLAYTDHNVNPEFTTSFYLNQIAPITRMPDKVIYLDVDPDVAASRMKSRGEAADAIEAKGSEFQKGVYKSFKKYMDQNQNVDIIKIDASRDLVNVKMELDAFVNKLINEVSDINNPTNQPMM